MGTEPPSPRDTGGEEARPPKKTERGGLQDGAPHLRPTAEPLVHSGGPHHLRQMHQDDSPEGVTTPSDAHQPGGAPPSVDDAHVEEGKDSGYVDGDTPQDREAAYQSPAVEATGETWGGGARLGRTPRPHASHPRAKYVARRCSKECGILYR